MQGFAKKLQELQEAFDAANDRCVDLRERAEKAERDLAACTTTAKRLLVQVGAANEDAARLAALLMQHHDDCDDYPCDARAALAAHDARVKGGAPR